MIQGFSPFLFVLAESYCKTANAPGLLQYSGCAPSLFPAASKTDKNPYPENAPTFLGGCITKRLLGFRFDNRAFVLLLGAFDRNPEKYHHSTLRILCEIAKFGFSCFSDIVDCCIHEALVSQYGETKAERDLVAAEIRQKGIRRREFQRFITTLEKLPEEVTTFEDAMWSSLVDYVTVNGKDDLRFTLACGTEMRV